MMKGRMMRSMVMTEMLPTQLPPSHVHEVIRPTEKAEGEMSEDR
jgi:hypothetical protein